MEKLLVKVLLSNKIEKMMQESRERMNTVDEYLRQDNADLEELERRYEHLNIHSGVKWVIEDYIACMRSHEERVSELSYYSGIVDAIKLMKSMGVLAAPQKI